MSSGGWIRSLGLDRNSPLSPREWRVAAAPESRVKLREFRFYQAEAECEPTGYEEIYREKRSLIKAQIVSMKLGSFPYSERGNSQWLSSIICKKFRIQSGNCP